MERRRTKRVESVKPVTIEFPDSDDWLAFTLNLSQAGAAVEIMSSDPFSIPVDRELLLTIDLGEKVVPARGRVIYQRQKDERQVVVGVLFTEILPDDRQAIAGFLRK